MASSRPVGVLSTGITVEGFVFPPSVLPPASDNPFFLGGAGVRGIMIEGEFVKFTVIGVYMEQGAVEALAHKWMGKSARELAESNEFFSDIVTGPFEKFFQVSMIKTLSGPEFSRKVAENCVAICKAFETYTEAEEKVVEKFLEMFKHHNFTPGCSVLYKQSPLGSLTIAFGKHDARVEEVATAGVIDNGPLSSRAVLESIIGKDGVSPATRESLATRLHECIEADKKLKLCREN